MKKEWCAILMAAVMSVSMGVPQVLAQDDAAVVMEQSELAGLIDVVEEDGFWIDTNTGTILQYDDILGGGALVIPETIAGIPVTAIGDEAFSGCDELTSIEIPSCVTSIGTAAFDMCFSLSRFVVSAESAYYSTDARGVLYDKDQTTLVQYPIACEEPLYEIPGTVTEIFPQALRRASCITITIPPSVTTIGDQAFDLCMYVQSFEVDAENPNYCSDDRGWLLSKDRTQLIQYPLANEASPLDLPDSVTVIGPWALAYADIYGALEIPDRITTIDAWAFSDTDITSVNIPSSVMAIGERAFASCDRLNTFTVDASNPFFSADDCGVLFNQDKTMLIRYPEGRTESAYTVPSSVTSLANWAFADGNRLTTLELPDSITAIGAGAFWRCTSLTALELPSGITAIEEKTFFVCTGLTDMVIPSGVSTIGSMAFTFCDRLKTITIPQSVTTIEMQAFFDCRALSTVFYGGSEDEWYQISIQSRNEDLEHALILFAADADVPECESATIMTTRIVTSASSGLPVVRAWMSNRTWLTLEGTVYVAVYDADGLFKDCAETPLTLSLLEERWPEVTLDCTLAAGDVIRVFYWNETMRPYARAFQYTQESEA